MTEMMQCLVNYFGFNVDVEGRPRNYYSYHVVGGPGPMSGTGAASITLLAAYDVQEVFPIAQHFHVVQKGGPAAAIEKAVHYLDVFHAEDRLRKVQTEIRSSAFASTSPKEEKHQAPKSVTLTADSGLRAGAHFLSDSLL